MKRLVALLSVFILVFSNLIAQEQEKTQEDTSQKEINELKERILQRVEERLKVEQEKIMEQVRQLLDSELPKLYKKEEVAKVEEKQGFLGIATAVITKEQKTQLGYEGENGIVVTQVFPNTPAARIGLMPGDIVYSLNEEVVNDVEKFREALKKYKAGDFVTLKFWRQGNELTMKVKLAPKPEQPVQAQAQVQQQPQQQPPQQQAPQQQLPERVKCMVCGNEMGLEEAKNHRHEVQLKCTICGKTLGGDEAKAHHHHVQPQQVAVPGYLGVQLAELESDKKKESKYDGEGVYVESVQENSPADYAGLEEGDIVEAINNEYVSTLPELRSIIASKRAGEVVTLTVWRNGKEKDLEATLAPMIDKKAPPQRKQRQVQPQDDEDEGGNYSGALQHRINRFLESLEEKPKEKVEVKNVAPKPYLGIQVQQSKDGLSVIKVVENSPAHKAGLAIGDTIKAINGVTLDSEKVLHNFMGNSSPDSKVTITVLREGKEFAVEATLGVRQ